MHIITQRFAVVVVACLGLMALFISCCDRENPIKPPPDTDTTDYKVYFADADHPYTYFAYHTASGVLDSFTLPYRCDSGFAVSPDGTTMYLHTAHSVVVVDLDSLTLRAEHTLETKGNQMSISPDGAFLGVLHTELTIVRTSDFSVVYHGAAYSFNGIFSSDSKTFYCATIDEQNYIYLNRIRLGDSLSVDSTYFADGATWRIVPTRDESLWFLFLWIWNDYFVFDVYNTLTDSVVYRMGFAPGHGDMEITPDGRYVIFSQPGRLNSDVPPPLYFTIFDVLRNRIYGEISTKGIADTISPNGLPVGEICITPNGRHLIGLAGGGTGQLFDFDLISMRFVRYIFFGWNKYPINLVCQSSP